MEEENRLISDSSDWWFRPCEQKSIVIYQHPHSPESGPLRLLYYQSFRHDRTHHSRWIPASTPQITSPPLRLMTMHTTRHDPISFCRIFEQDAQTLKPLPITKLFQRITKTAFDLPSRLHHVSRFIVVPFPVGTRNSIRRSPVSEYCFFSGGEPHRPGIGIRSSIISRRICF